MKKINGKVSKEIIITSGIFIALLIALQILIAKCTSEVIKIYNNGQKEKCIEYGKVTHQETKFTERNGCFVLKDGEWVKYD